MCRRFYSLPNAERGGFEPPKPVSQFNGLANRLPLDANTDSRSGLRHINDGLPTALPTDTCRIDPILSEIMNAWADLPDAIRDDILAIVRAAVKGRQST